MPTIKVSFAGDSWMVGDLTLDEFAAIEEATRASWVTFNPLLSAKQARAALTALVARSVGYDEAARKIGAMSIREAVDCFEVVRDDMPEVYSDGIPKEEAAQETNGLSGAPPASDGLPT